jgi:hypothetical protein
MKIVDKPYFNNWNSWTKEDFEPPTMCRLTKGEFLELTRKR